MRYASIIKKENLLELNIQVNKYVLLTLAASGIKMQTALNYPQACIIALPLVTQHVLILAASNTCK